MARFVIASRRAGKFTRSDKESARAALDATLAGPLRAHARVVCACMPSEPTARAGAVLEAPPDLVARVAAALPPDVVLEPEILHRVEPVLGPVDFLPAPPNAPAVSPPFAAPPGTTGLGRETTLRIRVVAAGEPGAGDSGLADSDASGAISPDGGLHGAQVTAFLRGSGIETRTSALTDRRGWATVRYADLFTVSALVVTPAGEFWPMLQRGVTDRLVVSCPPLPPAKGRLGWWHETVGVERYAARRGRGVTVGVIDTGTGPHPELAHVVDAGAFLEGDVQRRDGAGTDVDRHGTHVCGLIGARPKSAMRFAGIAPGARLISARVFEPEDATPGAGVGGANQLDIANAIDTLSKKYRADLLNLSLGAGTGSRILEDAIDDAWERGTVCVCAAGNGAGALSYPAAFARTVAVTALGRLGWGPPGSLSAARVPTERDRFGKDELYLASFSNFGPEVTCTAPGVGVIAPVPERYGLAAPFAAMDGTSMASPIATGTLAAILAGESEPAAAWRASARNTARSVQTVRALTGTASSVGVLVQYEGRGVLRADKHRTGLQQ